VNEQQINIATRAGSVDTFICRPEHAGPWPGIIFYMDAPGIREELRDMARRIATVGYYVVLPNLYYRHGHGTTLSAEATVQGSPERARMQSLMSSLSNRQIAEDTDDLLTFIDRQPEVRKGPLGCVGYCMSGPFVTVAGSHFPERFGAIASLYGVKIANDNPDSSHLGVGRIRGEAYYGFGETDELTPSADIERLRHALEAAKTRAIIEIYPGVGHGFAFPSRAKYDKPSAERHWERLFDLFRRNLH
jgi:carboxymethylenebutenolidase